MCYFLAKMNWIVRHKRERGGKGIWDYLAPLRSINNSKFSHGHEFVAPWNTNIRCAHNMQIPFWICLYFLDLFHWNCASSCNIQKLFMKAALARVNLKKVGNLSQPVFSSLCIFSPCWQPLLVWHECIRKLIFCQFVKYLTAGDAVNLPKENANVLRMSEFKCNFTPIILLEASSEMTWGLKNGLQMRGFII